MELLCLIFLICFMIERSTSIITVRARPGDDVLLPCEVYSKSSNALSWSINNVQIGVYDFNQNLVEMENMKNDTYHLYENGSLGLRNVGRHYIERLIFKTFEILRK